MTVLLILNMITDMCQWKQVALHHWWFESYAHYIPKQNLHLVMLFFYSYQASHSICAVCWFFPMNEFQSFNRQAATEIIFSQLIVIDLSTCVIEIFLVNLVVTTDYWRFHIWCSLFLYIVRFFSAAFESLGRQCDDIFSTANYY